MRGVRLFRSIQIKLIMMVLLLILIAVQLIGVYFISTMKTSLINSFSGNLNDQANLLTTMLSSSNSNSEASLQAGAEGTLSDLVSNFFTNSGAEVQVLDAGGKVLATSNNTQSYIGRKNTSLLVSRALQGVRDNEEEIIDENNVRNKVIAKPIFSGDKIVGAVYIVASMNDLYQTMENINRIFVSATLIALGLTAVLGVLLAGTITSPIKALTRQAGAVAEGRFNERVPVFGRDEIGQLSVAFNEMTDRLSDALAVNEEEKEKLASILSNMSDGVLATDEVGSVIVTNRRARAMLGLREPRDGTTLSEALGIAKEPIAETLQGRESSMLLHRETDDGTEDQIYRVTLTPIRRRDRGVAGAIAVLQDVTEAEKLEQSRREFVANVSHELRTPLTTIKSYAEALDDGALDEPPLADRFVGVIRSETERMIRLVTDLLHLSRFDSRRNQLLRQHVDLLEMLEEVVDRFSFQLRQKAITVSVKVEETHKAALLDRDGIDQVLDNLVSNAIKYTLDGGSIDITARTNEMGQLAIAIKDTGIGIPKKDLPRIFERFYRVDKARSRNMGGTGLGLSIAREIVRAHGGSMTIDSEMNVGTVVTVLLPIVPEGSESA